MMSGVGRISSASGSLGTFFAQVALFHQQDLVVAAVSNTGNGQVTTQGVVSQIAQELLSTA